MSSVRCLKLGIVGCGAIGSRIGLSSKKELKNKFTISALHDIDSSKAIQLAKKIGNPRAVKDSLDGLIDGCDLVVECVNTSATLDIVRKSLLARKAIMVMSIGRLFGNTRLFSLARKNNSTVLLPSGSIAGLDAVKAASLAGLVSVTLTSRKPPSGFSGNSYLAEQRVDVDKTRKEVILFDGDAASAVRHFPQNINVAAVLQLASGSAVDLRVRIIADPKVKSNIHEIVLEGAAGRVVTRSENVVCSDNPKTSYLAVLSGIQTLKQYFDCIKIGT